MDYKAEPLVHQEAMEQFEGSKELGFKTISEGELIYELKDGTRFYIKVVLAKLFLREVTSDSGETHPDYGLEMFANVRRVRAEDVVK